MEPQRYGTLANHNNARLGGEKQKNKKHVLTIFALEKVAYVQKIKTKLFENV